MHVMWKDTASAKNYAPLSTDIDVDVAIIGAGITGLTTAWYLSRAGLTVAVLESFQVGAGTTGSSTGNLYSPIGPGLFSIESKHGLATLQGVAAAREAAIGFIADRALEDTIECGFRRVPFHLFSAPDDRAAGKVKKEYDAARKAGLAVSDAIPRDFPFPAVALTTVMDQAQFNPLQYIQGLAAVVESDNCRIYEGTQVIASEDGKPCRVETSAGTVVARHVVKATHTPQGKYAVHTAMLPQREYAVVARVSGETLPEGIYWNANPAYPYSIRPYRQQGENYVMVLGEPHKPGEQKDEDVNRMEAFLREHFSVTDIAYSWAAQNYQPADHLPYIGTSPMEDNTFIATGFAADGLVYGTLAGLLISDAIGGRENSWAHLFDPKRFTPAASAKKVVMEGLNSSKHLLKDYLFYGQASDLDQVPRGEGRTLKLEGERVAVYRDEQGKLEVVSAVCTHMGCIVHWNHMEKSWDCPCHGSRFSVQGKVLEGPAQHNLAGPKSEPDPV